MLKGEHGRGMNEITHVALRSYTNENWFNAYIYVCIYMSFMDQDAAMRMIYRETSVLMGSKHAI